MKPIILGASVQAAASITAGQWVKQGTSGTVAANDAAATGIGMAESSQVVGNISYTGKIGVIKQGLVKMSVADNTYAFGDSVSLDSDGQTGILGSSAKVGTAAESKTTSVSAGTNTLLVYINLP